MRIAILGCGDIGVRVGSSLVELGHAIIGVRRQPPTHAAHRFEIIAGDAGDDALYAQLGEVDALLLAANPGVRRGRDNGLARAAGLMCSRYAYARLVYTSTTSVYGDAGGAEIDEHGALAQDAAALALQAIEQPFLSHANALVLRVAAIVGPTRTHAADRLRSNDTTVRGALDRPFSYIHEQDLAEILVEALTGNHGQGVVNCAAPARISVGDYYRTLARRIGIDPGRLTGDGAAVASRRIMAPRLQASAAGRAWRTID